MSDPLLEEYKAYYAVRAEKYAGNPNYALSYEAEKNLSSAMQGCQKLEDFKDALGNLNELCATALIKDEAIMEREHFKKHQENIRIKASLETLEKADGCKDVMDLITMVNEVSNKVSLEITRDEANRQFIYDWDIMNNIEIYANAEVPDKYKPDMQRWANELRQILADRTRSTTEEMQKWGSGWKINPDLMMEYRHRRLLPYSDEHIRERIAFFKQINNL